MRSRGRGSCSECRASPKRPHLRGVPLPSLRRQTRARLGFSAVAPRAATGGTMSEAGRSAGVEAHRLVALADPEGWLGAFELAWRTDQFRV